MQKEKKKKNKKKKLLSKKQSKKDENVAGEPSNAPQAPKKLLKEGEKEYPSLFAKIWREHQHQKEKDKTEGEDEEEENSWIPYKYCCFGWILFSELNHIFNHGEHKKIMKQNMNPLPPPVQAQTLIKQSTKIIQNYTKSSPLRSSFFLRLKN